MRTKSPRICWMTFSIARRWVFWKSLFPFQRQFSNFQLYLKVWSILHLSCSSFRDTKTREILKEKSATILIFRPFPWRTWSKTSRSREASRRRKSTKNTRRENPRKNTNIDPNPGKEIGTGTRIETGTGKGEGRAGPKAERIVTGRFFKIFI